MIVDNKKVIKNVWFGFKTIIRLFAYTSLHLLLQFYAWALADGATHEKFLWNILQFPIFSIFSKDISTIHFENLFLINSFLWGVCISGVFLLIDLKKMRNLLHREK